MIKRNKILAVLLLIVITACTVFMGCGGKENKNDASSPQSKVQKVQRFGMITGLKVEKMAYYKKLHAAVWPGVLKKLTECHIRNYSIYIQKIDSKYFLFSYFEYTGVDFNKDMQKMAADSTTQRWWKETDPTQIPLPEAAAQKKIWANMDMIFHAE